MTSGPDEIEDAIEVFVRGYCAEKSTTHPYEHARIGELWVIRDTPRRRSREIQFRSSSRPTRKASRQNRAARTAKMTPVPWYVPETH
jgi:hypothetical protein